MLVAVSTARCTNQFNSLQQSFAVVQSPVKWLVAPVTRELVCFACSEHSGRHGEHLAGLLPHATCRGEAKVSRERERGGGEG